MKKYFAVVDPNWGEPFPIPETIRASAEEAEDAFVSMMKYSLYHGGSEHPYPNGKKGSLETAKSFGNFHIAEVEVEFASPKVRVKDSVENEYNVPENKLDEFYELDRQIVSTYENQIFGPCDEHIALCDVWAEKFDRYMI